MLRVNLNENSFKYYANVLSILFLVANISAYLHNITFENKNFLENFLEVSNFTMVLIFVGIILNGICTWSKTYFGLYNVSKVSISLGIYLAFLCWFVGYYIIDNNGISWNPFLKFIVLLISFPLTSLLAMYYKTNDAIFLCRIGLMSICVTCCQFIIIFSATFLQAKATIGDIIEAIVIGGIAIVCIDFQIHNIRNTFSTDFEKFIPKEERKIGICGIVYAIYFAIFHIFSLYLNIITL